MSPLRVAVLHNRYAAANPSGENVVVDQEIALLRAAGHDVVPYVRSSDEIAQWSARRKAMVPLQALWSRQAGAEVSRLIETHRPDVVQLHNPYPLLSPSVLAVAERRRVPVVQTVHNYRHACMKGTLVLGGQPCERCVGKRVPLSGVVHGCYRDSRAQSVVMATSLASSRNRWQHDVSRYLVLTEFMAELLGRHGLPRERMVLRPQAVADPGEPAPPGVGFLYVGRLDAEKGVDLLLDAWRRTELPDPHRRLTVIGDGTLRSQVVGAGAGVRFVGRQDPSGVQAALRAAAVVVIPSRAYEGMPMVAIEAMAAGRPLVVTTGGALPEVVGATGWPAAPTPAALAAALTQSVRSADELQRRSALARRRYLDRHTEAHLVRLLEDTYAGAVAAAST